MHLEVPGSACDKSRSAGDKSGSSSNHGRAVWEQHLLWECYRCAWDAAGAPGMLQVRLEYSRCAWDAAGAPGMQQVHLEIIATTYHATIVKIHIFRLYSHLFFYVSIYLCLYIVTHLHTIYLDWLQMVVESNLRCA